MTLSFKQLCSILSKRYDLNAAEAAENVKAFNDCVSDRESRLEWLRHIRDEDAFHRHLDELEALGEEYGMR